MGGEVEVCVENEGDDRIVKMEGEVEVVVENEVDDRVVKMGGEVEVSVENEVDDGVKMEGEVEVVVENMRVEVSEGDVDGIQRRDNTDKHKVDRIIQEIVTNVLEYSRGMYC